jgi:hypothetical protein
MSNFFNKNFPWLALGMALLLWALGISTAMAESKDRTPIIVGWVEDVYVEAIDTQFKAKLDTGAKTSSIDAKVIDIVEYTPSQGSEAPSKETKKEAAGRIIFSVVDAEGKSKTLERDIVRFVRIKRKGNAGFIRRPVVHMRFCLAGRVIDEEVNLAVRQRFIYPVLIGRNMLEKGGLVVDASRMLTSPSTCPKKTTGA